jgi:hypothetical protein
MRLIAIVALALLSGLTGCATMVLPQRDAGRTPVEDLLAYYHRISVATPEMQRREFTEATTAQERAPDNGTRLRLALTLMLPGAPWRDDARAAQLLAAVELPEKDANVAAQRDFVVLLEKMLQGRREEQKKCEQKLDALRDDRRKLEQRYESAREECKRADLLQQKLDELRDIDRDLRSKRPSRRTKP